MRSCQPAGKRAGKLDDLGLNAIVNIVRPPRHMLLHS